jgi:hypothetical protein
MNEELELKLQIENDIAKLKLKLSKLEALYEIMKVLIIHLYNHLNIRISDKFIGRSLY